MVGLCTAVQMMLYLGFSFSIPLTRSVSRCEEKNFNQLLLLNAFIPFFRLILISYSTGYDFLAISLSQLSLVSLCLCYWLALLLCHRYLLCHYLMLHHWKTKLLMRMPFFSDDFPFSKFESRWKEFGFSLDDSHKDTSSTQILKTISWKRPIVTYFGGWQFQRQKFVSYLHHLFRNFVPKTGMEKVYPKMMIKVKVNSQHFNKRNIWLQMTCNRVQSCFYPDWIIIIIETMFQLIEVKCSFVDSFELWKEIILVRNV